LLAASLLFWYAVVSRAAFPEPPARLLKKPPSPSVFPSLLCAFSLSAGLYPDLPKFPPGTPGVRGLPTIHGRPSPISPPSSRRYSRGLVDLYPPAFKIGEKKKKKSSPGGGHLLPVGTGQTEAQREAGRGGRWDSPHRAPANASGFIVLSRRPLPRESSPPTTKAVFFLNLRQEFGRWPGPSGYPRSAVDHEHERLQTRRAKVDRSDRASRRSFYPLPNDQP